MINANKKQHILGFIMLSMTAIFWGAGFVLNDQLLTSSFQNTPNLLNAVRFVVSAIALLAIFAKDSSSINIRYFTGLQAAQCFSWVLRCSL